MGLGARLLGTDLDQVVPATPHADRVFASEGLGVRSLPWPPASKPTPGPVAPLGDDGGIIRTDAARAGAATVA